jgi:hypothetical protein
MHLLPLFWPPCSLLLVITWLIGPLLPTHHYQYCPPRHFTLSSPSSFPFPSPSREPHIYSPLPTSLVLWSVTYLPLFSHDRHCVSPFHAFGFPFFIAENLHSSFTFSVPSVPLSPSHLAPLMLRACFLCSGHCVHSYWSSLGCLKHSFRHTIITQSTHYLDFPSPSLVSPAIAPIMSQCRQL